MSDDAAIRALVAELAVQADSGTLEDYLALFTEDAVWEMDAHPGRGIPADHRTGHAEIAASVEQRRGLGVQGPGTGTMHHLTTVLLDVDGDEAMGHLYYQFAGLNDGVPTIRTIGQYFDRYRRTGTGWKLAHRRIVLA